MNLHNADRLPLQAGFTKKEPASQTSINKSCKKPNKKELLTTAKKENSSESEFGDESVESSEEEDEDSDESIAEKKRNILHWHQTPRMIFVLCVGFIVSTRFRGELNWKMIRYNL